MKKLIGLFILAVIIGVGMASYSYAAGDMAAISTQTVNGDLLKIDGEFYVLKDMAGKEIRLHVDKVEAQATEKNHAASIKHVQPKM